MRPSPSPTPTAWPAWCARISPPRMLASVPRRRASRAAGCPSPLGLPDGSRCLWPALPSPHTRPTPRREGSVHALSRRLADHAEGMIFIALPEEENFEPRLLRIKDTLATANTALSHSKAFLSRRRSCPHRSAGPTGGARQYPPRRHRRRALSRPPPAASAGCAHLHPREMHHQRRRLPSRSQCRAASEIAARDGAAFSPATRTRFTEPSRSPTPAASRSTS